MQTLTTNLTPSVLVGRVLAGNGNILICQRITDKEERGGVAWTTMVVVFSWRTRRQPIIGSRGAITQSWVQAGSILAPASSWRCHFPRPAGWRCEAHVQRCIM